MSIEPVLFLMLLTAITHFLASSAYLGPPGSTDRAEPHVLPHGIKVPVTCILLQSFKIILSGFRRIKLIDLSKLGPKDFDSTRVREILQLRNTSPGETNSSCVDKQRQKAFCGMHRGFSEERRSAGRIGEVLYSLCTRVAAWRGDLWG
jgi:hypothetical protein